MAVTLLCLCSLLATYPGFFHTQTELRASTNMYMLEPSCAENICCWSICTTSVQIRSEQVPQSCESLQCLGGLDFAASSQRTPGRCSDSNDTGSSSVPYSCRQTRVITGLGCSRLECEHTRARLEAQSPVCPTEGASSLSSVTFVTTCGNFRVFDEQQARKRSL